MEIALGLLDEVFLLCYRWDPLLPPWLAGNQGSAAAPAGDAGVSEQPVPRLTR